MSGLFETKAPLAEQLRPADFAHVVGQDHVLGEDGFIARCVKAKKPTSFILWGPPGCGKTTIARIYAHLFDAHFEQLSGISSGVADLKRVIEEAKGRLAVGQRTILFMDEVHRYNRAQQDTFLPYVEDGTFILVGATTENPSFKLNAALLSRVQVITLKQLDEKGLSQILDRAGEELGPLHLTDEARELLLNMAGGDGRYLLGMVEALHAVQDDDTPYGPEDVANVLQKRAMKYDQAGEEHYNLISTLHKAVRGSDVDGALYWFWRMIEGGEDPLYIARRLMRMANEDIGLADPAALGYAIDARQAYETMGSPEGELALAQMVAYLALAPKSNALYTASNMAMKLARKTSEHGPPRHAVNAPTKLMKAEGYGDGYLYDHDQPDGFSGQNYFPDDVPRTTLYKPVERGFEREMKKRLHYFEKLRKDRNT